METMDQQSLLETQSAGSNGYAFEGHLLLIAAIVSVSLVVVLLVGLHLYTRWCLRRGGAAQSARVAVLADNHLPGSAADRSLDAAVLSSLPVFRHSSKAAEPEGERPLLECAVCLSDFEENDIVRLLPKCSHCFHIECIDMWFHSHSTCPICRSPVEPAENRFEPSPVVVGVAEEVGGQEPGCSVSGPCATCHHGEGNATVNDDTTTSLATRRKPADGGFTSVKIDVAPPRRAEFENELTQGSPATRLLSFKRLLSMGRRSPSPRHVAGTSRERGPAELDLESGLGDHVRVDTPK